MTETAPLEARLPDKSQSLTAAESALADVPGPALAAAYQEMHQATLALLDGLSDAGLSTMIPACPAWTVRELIAHMTGTAADAVAARFPAVNPHGPWAERRTIIDAFTAGQVTTRQAIPAGEVLGEWAKLVPVLAKMLRGEQPFPDGSLPIINWMVVCDISAHHHDIRGGLGIPGNRESAGVGLSLQRYVAGVSQRIAAAGLPALRLCTERSEYVAGRGSPSTTVTATEWELFRALCSRRSPSQLRSLNWSGDPEIYLPLLPAYGLPADDLIE